jgi:hypothetical protein
MFIEQFIATFISQLIFVGVAAGIIYYVTLKQKKRNYDHEYLYASASSTLLLVYLQNRFPKSVSDKTVPFPDGESIPAPLFHDQNMIPLTSHEILMREEAIKEFIVAKYGNIRTFHQEVIESFTDNEDDDDIEESEADSVEQNIDEKLNEMDEVHVKKFVKKEHKEMKDVPEPKNIEENSKESPKESPKESSKEPTPKESPKDSKESSKEEKKKPKERSVKSKPKKEESDSESDIVIERQPPIADGDSDSDSSEVVAKKPAAEIDVDDDFIQDLLEKNAVKKVKTGKPAMKTKK